MEKYYIIREVSEEEALRSDVPCIAEDELLSRLATIRLGPTLPTRRWIAILLHGEGEKGEEKLIPIDMTEAENKRWADYQQKLSQPSPIPSRQEWEKWAAKLTDCIDDLIHDQLDTWIELKDAFLAMPGVPKE